ncbi:GFA family protein [Asticcacaulis machinosus]|uniref:GFA family protein n=1 Tax=Asticcacaulis machinosus TaxID=2984211 RepID=A0ABT5HL64_9CAUL|nr:GFA family protein [Asticcacaulis machinosus]MDC7676983.1 GFA family protein [Asticcacaulis machinosus]
MLHTGSCHCGKISFEVEGDFKDAIDCNCSYCRRRGSLLAFVGKDALHLKTDPADIETYRFNTMKIAHNFCKVCGVEPYGEGTAPNGKPMIAVNLRCLPDVDLEKLTINKWNGAEH